MALLVFLDALLASVAEEAAQNAVSISGVELGVPNSLSGSVSIALVTVVEMISSLSKLLLIVGFYCSCH